MHKFNVYKDNTQWVPCFKWFWYRPLEPGMGHGPYPSKALAWIAGWIATR